MNRAQAALASGWFPGSLSPLGNGHINNTYLVTTKQGRFVLQEINASVFDDPLTVVANYQRILPYLQRGVVNVPVLINTHAGNTQFVGGKGEVWRLTKYVENSSTLPKLDNLEQAMSAGRAFGEFQVSLSTCPVRDIDVVIPKFLQLDPYLKALDAVVAANGNFDQTVATVIEQNRYLATALGQRTGIIHGDCKVDNLRFDDNDQVCCVLDLDTVMVGHPAWDWGDLARSGMTNVEPNMRFSLLKAMATGFQQAVTLSKEELVLAPQYVAFMLGVRFLTDHLQGDVYFKVNRPGENLVRAQQQFALLEWFASIEEDLVHSGN